MEKLEQQIDHLYGLELSEFTGERDRLARELRLSDRREEAAEVKQLRKPTLSAWTINQLARRERRSVDLLLDAGHRLHDAQRGVLSGANAEMLDEARRTERAALADLREAAELILAEAGRASGTTLNRVMETLQTAAVSDEGRELLARGRLTGDLEATGFELLTPLAEGGLKPAAPRPPARGRAGKAETPKRATTRRRTTSERHQRAAQERIGKATERLRQARARAKAAAAEVQAAERDAAKARRELGKAEKRVRDAQASAARAEKAVERAGTEVREAERRAR